MTLPTSGSITLAMIAAELGVSLPIDLNSTAVRTLAGKPTGNVVMPTDFYGKSSLTFTISGQTTGTIGSRYRWFRRTITAVGNIGVPSFSIIASQTGRASLSGTGNTRTLETGYDPSDPSEFESYDLVTIRMVVDGKTIEKSTSIGA